MKHPAPQAHFGLLIVCLAFFVLAVMSKPTAVMLPMAMLLLDLWPFRRFSRQALFEKVPLFIIMVASAIITYYSQKHTANLFLPDSSSQNQRLFLVPYDALFYPLKMVWPARLTPHYPFPEPMNLTDSFVLVSIFWTLAVVLVLAWSLRKTRAAAVGAAIFMVMIFPAIGVIGFNNVPACNKFVYLPVVGIMVALAALGNWLWRRETPALWKRHGRIAIIAVAIAATAGEAAASRQYLSYWCDTETLYRYITRLAPNATYAREDLANELSRRGKYSEAIADYEKCLTERGDNRRSLSRVEFNLAMTLTFRKGPGDMERAMEHCQKSVELDPASARSHEGLGVLLREKGQLDEAVAQLQQAINLQPEFYEAYYHLGVTLTAQQKHAEAAQAYQRSVEIYSNYELGHLGLSLALEALGNKNAAYEEAVLAARAAHSNGRSDVEISATAQAQKLHS